MRNEQAETTEPSGIEFLPLCICKTDRDPFRPCPVPEADHVITPLTVLSSPNSAGLCLFVREWWDASTSRQRGQFFRSTLPTV
jgi:hypothetical protein